MRRLASGVHVPGLLVILLPLLTLPVLAQEGGEEAPARWWFTAGLGPGSEAVAGVVGFDLALDRHLLSVRGAATADILGPGFWDVGLLYGRSVRWEAGGAGASVGLGVMGGDRSSGLGGSEPVGTRLGVPVALRVAWHPTPFAGFGTYGFVNINGEELFGGVALIVELGDLR